MNLSDAGRLSIRRLTVNRPVFVVFAFAFDGRVTFDVYFSVVTKPSLILSVR